MDADTRDDRDLLAATASDPHAFGVFYRRHLPGMLAFFMNRTRNTELTADLAAETFAAALVSAPRYRAGAEPASAWLYGIARHKLADSLRRGRVESAARERLRMEPLELTDDDLERVVELADSGAVELRELLGELPADQREALAARVLDEREYPEIAAELGCSELVVRKRVSRGLARLRERLEGAK